MATKKQINTGIMLPVLLLLGYGVVMIFSASMPTAALSPACNYDPYFFLKRHLLWMTAGFVAMIIGFRMDVMKLRKWSLFIALMAILMLALVLIPSLGKEILGARRSIGVGPFTFQPVEFAKIALILYMADALARRKDNVNDWKQILSILGIFVIMVVLVEKQPDLGSTITLGGTFIGLLFMGGVNIWHIFFLVTAGGGLAVARIMDESYRIKRILAFLNPWEDPAGIGYQIIQSFIALGAGGITGMGLGESRQKYFYLPEKFTDFIFAIIGEELGLYFGTIPIVVLFVILLFFGIKTAVKSRNNFMCLLAGGITFQIVIQAFINMGVVSGLLPCTGIPLPFISFGGSSLVFTLFSVGLLLNVAGEPKRKIPLGESCEIPRSRFRNLSPEKRMELLSRSRFSEKYEEERSDIRENFRKTEEVETEEKDMD